MLVLDEDNMYNLSPPTNATVVDYLFSITIEADGGATLITTPCHIILTCSNTSKYFDAEVMELDSSFAYDSETEYILGVSIQP